MNTSFNRSITLFLTLAASTLLMATSFADPLSNEVLKFQQKPMLGTSIVDTTGQVGTYFGHDELSTIYGPGNNAAQPIYQGQFMADDFSDLVSSPVVHISWWGSYHGTHVPPQNAVQQFLIAFDSDDPTIQGQNGQPDIPSKPKSPIQYEIVNAVPSGPLVPGSGTFTEAFTGVVDSFGDPIFKYNAELANPFPEQANTVYWLKIAALVNVPPATPVPPPPGTQIEWGWHNRDYTIQDPLASNAVAYPGGERNQNTVAAPIWHYQDDAVQGRLTFLPGAPGGINGQIIQTNPLPQFYVDGADGPQGIGNFSKDLAFELYTTQVNVPEPTSCVLMGLGLAGIFAARRRSRTA
jgi:hypothetical protein